MENYTTTDLIARKEADKEATADEKAKEKSKIVVSNDAFLNAEMIDKLIIKIEQARLSSLMKR